MKVLRALIGITSELMFCIFFMLLGLVASFIVLVILNDNIRSAVIDNIQRMVS